MNLSHRLMPAVLLVLALAAPMGPAPSPAVAAERRSLTNGCSASPRGIPGCGAYVGGVLTGNAPVRSWERQLGGKIGVRRTYWQAGQIRGAVEVATVDARHNRLPWLSFKAPYSWADMAAGRGDSWARRVATRLATVPGPVWVAVHHEPENDSRDLTQWTAMQARIAPIMRAAAPNLGYSIILMGYHQFQGSDPRYHMNRIWPATKIDVAGFDIYEHYALVKNGVARTKWTRFGRDYFRPIKKWARSKGVAWGIAETGYNHAASKVRPNWPRRTYRKLKRFDGVAFSYFNTEVNSVTSWPLTKKRKIRAFARITQRAVRLR